MEDKEDRIADLEKQIEEKTTKISELNNQINELVYQKKLNEADLEGLHTTLKRVRMINKLVNNNTTVMMHSIEIDFTVTPSEQKILDVLTEPLSILEIVDKIGKDYITENTVTVKVSQLKLKGLVERLNRSSKEEQYKFKKTVL